VSAFGFEAKASGYVTPGYQNWTDGQVADALDGWAETTEGFATDEQMQEAVRHWHPLLAEAAKRLRESA